VDVTSQNGEWVYEMDGVRRTAAAAREFLENLVTRHPGQPVRIKVFSKDKRHSEEDPFMKSLRAWAASQPVKVYYRPAEGAATRP
jgi:hypothetical protein